jgi:general secretion pathway protein G
MNKFKASVQRGFTLVELVIVVLILSVLAAIVIPQFTSSTDDAKLAALDSSLSGVRTAIDMYYQQHGHYPSSVPSSGAACSGSTGTGAADSEQAFMDQLSRYTNIAGESCNIGTDVGFVYGPYYKKDKLPKDPIIGVKDAVLISNSGDLDMAATDDSGGWKFDNKAGKFIINHSAYENR